MLPRDAIPGSRPDHALPHAHRATSPQPAPIAASTGRSAACVLALTLAALWMAGCSTMAWYEGMKFRAQNECHRLPPGETESCLARVNTMTYDDYERSRQGRKL